MGGDPDFISRFEKTARSGGFVYNTIAFGRRTPLARGTRCTRHRLSSHLSVRAETHQVTSDNLDGQIIIRRLIHLLRSR
jgi:hypothetical protein